MASRRRRCDIDRRPARRQQAGGETLAGPGRGLESGLLLSTGDENGVPGHAHDAVVPSRTAVPPRRCPRATLADPEARRDGGYYVGDDGRDTAVSRSDAA